MHIFYLFFNVYQSYIYSDNWHLPTTIPIAIIMIVVNLFRLITVRVFYYLNLLQFNYPISYSIKYESCFFFSFLFIIYFTYYFVPYL